jgi:chromosome segregation ATPase
MMEDQGVVFVIPFDKTPSSDLSERIVKTIDACKGTIEEHYKKKTFYIFLSSLIAHIVAAIIGDVKVEDAKEFKEIKENSIKLEKELKLRTEILQASIEESKKLKVLMEENEMRKTVAEKGLDELSQKYHNLEFLHKNVENRRNALQADYNTLMEEVKRLRKMASEKFELERNFKDIEKNKEEALSKLKESEEERNCMQEELNKAKAELGMAEQEVNHLRLELKLKTTNTTIGSSSGIEDSEVKSKRLEELTMELERLRESYIGIKSEYEDYQASQDLILKKNTNDLREVRRQYNKEKELTESLTQERDKLEKLNKELKDKCEALQRNIVPAKAVTPKEKSIVETLSMRIDKLTEENELLKKVVISIREKQEFFESESKTRLQLLVDYATKYTQDHLEEYKET